MRRSEVDLSVLWPFMAEDIAGYVAFLRREGAIGIAAAVEAAAPAWVRRAERSGTGPVSG